MIPSQLSRIAGSSIALASVVCALLWTVISIGAVAGEQQLAQRTAPPLTVVAAIVSGRQVEPSSPFNTSSPVPPISVSLPTPPYRVSAPEPPSSTSLPALPLK